MKRYLYIDAKHNISIDFEFLIRDYCVVRILIDTHTRTICVCVVRANLRQYISSMNVSVDVSFTNKI